MLRMRVPLSLVAAFVLIALVVGVLIGGRLIHDWNAAHNSVPAGSGTNLTELAQLESTPLNIPVLQPGDACPVDGPLDSKGRYGLGPAYGVGASPTLNAWGAYWHVAVVIETRVKGLVLVRGRDLKTQQAILFGGANAYGPVDPNNPQMHAEMVVDMSSQPNLARTAELSFPVTTGLAKGYSDCVEFQIDGRGFTEHFVGGTQ